jgi:repressor of nif and glnA expression
MNLQRKTGTMKPAEMDELLEKDEALRGQILEALKNVRAGQDQKISSKQIVEELAKMGYQMNTSELEAYTMERLDDAALNEVAGGLSETRANETSNTSWFVSLMSRLLSGEIAEASPLGKNSKDKNKGKTRL